MIVWLKRVGVTFAVVIGMLLFWRWILLLVAGLAALAAGTYLVDRWRMWRAVRRFRAVWGVHGKDLLLVYSNSPHWQRYIEETWIPRWGQRAVVLNWSERSTWGRRPRSEVALFRAFAGYREFNPLGIVVPAAGPVRVVRFWRAFREFKHGKSASLQAAEAELDRLLDGLASPTLLQSTNGAGKRA
jgi:hypothetical protein